MSCLPAGCRDAIARLNPAIPEDAREEALRKVLRHDAPSLIGNNRAFHQMLRDGVPVEYRRDDGSIAGDHVRLIDFDNPEANDWLAVNQFTVIEGQHNRRPDIVVFVNGLPLGVIELKIPEDTDIWFAAAYNQIQTYKQEIPSLLHYNAVTGGLRRTRGAHRLAHGESGVVQGLAHDRGRVRCAEDGAGVGDAGARGFREAAVPRSDPHFIVFEEDPDTGAVHKIIAGYHQFHAVKAAVEETVRASGKDRDRRSRGHLLGGQDAGRQRRRPPRRRRLAHARSRQELVDALLRRPHHRRAGDGESDAGFADRPQRPGRPTLRPVPALPRNPAADSGAGGPVEHLRKLLNVASGGVVFTTIQKFMPEEKGGKAPELSKRRNIIVIADEAHRSQYDLIDGLARNLRDSLPNASFIGFTGTPIEKTDANTRAVFGDYISIYDIQRAVADKATVPIYYESRMAKLGLNAERAAEDRRGIRRDHRRRRADAQGEAQDEVGRARSVGRESEADRARRRRSGAALRAPARSDGRQGDDRLHEPPHLRGDVQRDHQAAPRMGERAERR